jgi:hypothetical protein
MAGAKNALVTRRLWIVSNTTLGSKDLLSRITLAAPLATLGIPYRPLPWLRGAACSTTSWGPREPMSAKKFMAMVMRTWWVSMAPLGRPVVPEV